MNKPYEQSPRSDVTGLATGLILAMIAAMAISTAAHAEDRCSTPASLVLSKVRACELPRQGTPAELECATRDYLDRELVELIDSHPGLSGDIWLDCAPSKSGVDRFSESAINEPENSCCPETKVARSQSVRQ